MKVCTIFTILVISLYTQSHSEVSMNRERLLFDYGWKFAFGNTDITKDPHAGGGLWFGKTNGFQGAPRPGYIDALWRTVNLPHDWAVELPFDQNADGSHGFKPVGGSFPETSIGWYRRSFEIPDTDQGKRIFLEFDGVFRDCRVWVNGIYLGRNESGYSGFYFDITEVLNYGKRNEVTVRVDATSNEGWFYEGAGIYRHVWLVKTSPVHIGHWGTFVTAVPKDNTAEVTLRTTLNNDGNKPAEFDLHSNLVDAEGKSKAEIVTGSITLQPGEQREVQQKIIFQKPILWSLESPYLYKIISRVTQKEKLLDNYETKFGIRTIVFDKDQGFLLNGKPVVLKGTCNHQDHAGVGSALPDRVQYYRIERLKEMGCNAYRTSHNPPTPELLDACDELGMLVMDETRDFGTGPEALSQLERMIQRDRNHPSVILWSIGNEEGLQGSPTGRQIAERMQGLAHRLDSSRLCTYAANYPDYEGVDEVIDVRGWNYFLWAIDNYRKAHPEQCEVGSEQASHVSTRGVYAIDKTRGYVPSYMVNSIPWGNTSEEWWTFFAKRPWLSGGFVWTGFDYRGEPSPYEWPCINSHFGIMDTCGFPKDNFYYYQSWWNQQTVLHLLPHWNWPGKEGQEIQVTCYSNCDEVELFLNGKSMGRQIMPLNSHLDWKVKYEPGTLLAKGYKAGKEIAQSKVETTGTPVGVKLIPDRKVINADGEDVSMITVAVVDAQGRIVPTADNEISFETNAAGHLLGVGNGDPSSHEPDRYIPATDIKKQMIENWKMKMVENETDRPEIAENYNDADWEKVSVEGSPLMNKEYAVAVYRTTIDLSQKEFTGGKAIIHFGQIDDLGWIYLNGKKIGETRDWNREYTFDISDQLHDGKNSLAVIVKNITGPGGVGKGVWLETLSPPKPLLWKRQVFNGLAQVILQSAQQPGVMELTATSPGLEKAVSTIPTEKSTPRPVVP